MPLNIQFNSFSIFHPPPPHNNESVHKSNPKNLSDGSIKLSDVLSSHRETVFYSRSIAHLQCEEIWKKMLNNGYKNSSFNRRRHGVVALRQGTKTRMEEVASVKTIVRRTIECGKTWWMVNYESEPDVKLKRLSSKWWWEGNGRVPCILMYFVLGIVWLPRSLDIVPWFLQEWQINLTFTGCGWRRRRAAAGQRNDNNNNNNKKSNENRMRNYPFVNFHWRNIM